MRTESVLATLSFALALSAVAACGQRQKETVRAAGSGAELDRTVLPIPEPKTAPITEIDARKATAPPKFEVKAPKGAPNVVSILIDNMGFGDPASFGGPVNMPAFERLA